MEDERRPLRADAERNRRRLIDAATEIFCERGLDVGVGEIAERAGVGRGTLFRNFPSKEHLIAAIVVERMRESAARGRAALRSPDPGEAMFDLIEQSVGTKQTDLALFDALDDEWLANEEINAAHVELMGMIDELVRARAGSGHGTPRHQRRGRDDDGQGRLRGGALVPARRSGARGPAARPRARGAIDSRRPATAPRTPADARRSRALQAPRRAADLKDRLAAPHRRGERGRPRTRTSPASSPLRRGRRERKSRLTRSSTASLRRSRVETLEIEPEPLCARPQVWVLEPCLVGEQRVVHLPEAALQRRRLGRAGRRPRPAGGSSGPGSGGTRSAAGSPRGGRGARRRTGTRSRRTRSRSGAPSGPRT